MRPSKWSQEVQDRICKHIERGDRPTVAAEIEGIGRSTHYDWMAAGAREVEPFEGYRIAITRAEACYQQRARKRIQRGDDKGVSFGPAKAELEILSRRFPKEWAPRVRHEIEEVESHFFEALSRVCSNPETIKRVCSEKDLGVVFTSLCEELARLDGEGETRGGELEGEASEQSVH